MWTQDQDSAMRISLMKVKGCITITQYFTEDHFILQMKKGMTAAIVVREILVYCGNGLLIP